MDIDGTIYQPIYAANPMAFDARLTTAAGVYSLRIIRKIPGIDAQMGELTVPTATPAALVRTAELRANRITGAELYESRIEFDGQRFLIRSTKPKSAYEFVLVLEEERE